MFGSVLMIKRERVPFVRTIALFSFEKHFVFYVNSVLYSFKKMNKRMAILN